MMMEPMDLSALKLSDRRRDALVASVMLLSGQELTRRASAGSAIVFLGTWARPALAAAAILAAVCGSMLARSGSVEMVPGTGMAEALGLGSATAAWVVGDQAPRATDLVATIEEN